MYILPPFLVSCFQYLAPTLYYNYSRFFCDYGYGHIPLPLLFGVTNEKPIGFYLYYESSTLSRCTVRAVQLYKDRLHGSEFIIATMDIGTRAVGQVRLDRRSDTPPEHTPVPDTAPGSTDIYVISSGPLPPQWGLGGPYRLICPTATSSDLMETWKFTRPVPCFDFLRIANVVSNNETAVTTIPFPWAFMGVSKALWEGTSRLGPARKLLRKGAVEAGGSVFIPRSEEGQQRMRDLVAACRDLPPYVRPVSPRRARWNEHLDRWDEHIFRWKVHNARWKKHDAQLEASQEQPKDQAQREAWLKERDVRSEERWAAYEKHHHAQVEAGAQSEELMALREALEADLEDLRAEKEKLKAEGEELKARDEVEAAEARAEEQQALLEASTCSVASSD